MRKSIVVLGSTGSIGVKALRIAKNLNIAVKGLAVSGNIQLLEAQAREFSPNVVAVFEETAAKTLRENLRDTNVKVLSGLEGLCEVAALEGAEMVLNAVSGMIGLRPTLCAIEAGKDIALANKETLVAGGALVMKRAREKNVRLLPVDSEHSAIFQCMEGCREKKLLKKLILTASGGPFFDKDMAFLRKVTKEQALAHPNWSMGPKITIDSATMMNKGLEVIEAAWLFEVAPEDIDVVVHRESIIHSMVEFVDNSVLAQLGLPDMGIPIQYALTYPERAPSIVEPLSLTQLGKLTFYEPRDDVFRGISLCKEALNVGGTMPAILNGANEEAVRLFLEEKISFLEITEVVQMAMRSCKSVEISSLEDILRADEAARNFVRENVVKRGV